MRGERRTDRQTDRGRGTAQGVGGGEAGAVGGVGSSSQVGLRVKGRVSLPNPFAVEEQSILSSQLCLLRLNCGLTRLGKWVLPRHLQMLGAQHGFQATGPLAWARTSVPFALAGRQTTELVFTLCRKSL